MIPPADRTCPKCGNTIPFGTSDCSVCRQGRGAGKGAVALWIVLLIVIGGPAGLWGGCLILIGGLSGGSGSASSNVMTILSGIAFLLLPIFFLVMLIRAARK